MKIPQRVKEAEVEQPSGGQELYEILLVVDFTTFPLFSVLSIVSTTPEQGLVELSPNDFNFDSNMYNKNQIVSILKSDGWLQYLYLLKYL